jgi:peptidyl-prolyl cis-trans isomerase C
MECCMRLVAVVIAGLGMIGMAAAQDVVPASAKTKVVAVVNGKEISETAVERALKPVPKEARDKARADIVNFLIENALVDDYLDRLKVTVEAKEVDAQLETFKVQVKDAGQEYAKVLEKMEISEADLKREIQNQLRWDKFVASQLSDDKLKKLFEGSPEVFDGSTVRAKHILLNCEGGDAKVKEEALKKLQGIKAAIEKTIAEQTEKIPADADNLVKEKARIKIIDEAFAAQAREHSTCLSKRDGGDLGEFPRMGIMVEPFAKAAFAQKPYQIADPVVTQHGYHLILVTNRKAGELPKFDAVKVVVAEVYGNRLREAVVTAMKGDMNTKIERK